MHQLLPTRSHQEKLQKIQQLAGLTNVQKFKEEHDFSDELYRNWIKILGLNQVRKKKGKEDRILRMSETREKERKQQQKMKKKHVIQRKKAQR